MNKQNFRMGAAELQDKIKRTYIDAMRRDSAAVRWGKDKSKKRRTHLIV